MLAHDRLGPYVDDDAYLGAVLGRTSGRIGRAALRIVGDRHALSANAGEDHLHGGAVGFGRRLWDVEASGPARLVLSLRSEDGDQGYPGALEARIVFEVSEGSLRTRYEAEATAPTPVSLTHHPYYRLGGEDALGHVLRVNASRWTPLTEAGIPTGEVAEVAGTPVDLREGRLLRDVVAETGGLDHGLVPDGPLDLTLSHPGSGRSLRIASDQPHLQVYGGGKLEGAYGPHAGVALEPQAFPDAEAHPAFPSRLLRPGETYRRTVTVGPAPEGAG